MTDAFLKLHTGEFLVFKDFLYVGAASAVIRFGEESWTWKWRFELPVDLFPTIYGLELGVEGKIADKWWKWSFFEGRLGSVLEIRWRAQSFRKA